jgi:hypothetical protein
MTISTSMRRAAAVLAAAAFGLIGAGTSLGSLSMGAPSQWDNAQTGLTYALYHPKAKLGLKLNKLKLLSCGKGHDEWVAATYGTYHGVLGKGHGFSLYEGNPICSDPAFSMKVGTTTILGVSANIGVYCDPGKKCTKAQGVKHGFTIQWRAAKSHAFKGKGTQMQLDSHGLKFSQLLKVAHHLQPVLS